MYNPKSVYHNHIANAIPDFQYFFYWKSVVELLISSRSRSGRVSSANEKTQAYPRSGSASDRTRPRSSLLGRGRRRRIEDQSQLFVQ